MKIASYYNNNDVRVEEIPVPKIGKGEILLKTKATGICGSDLMEWYRTGNVPRVLGHEVAGEIMEVGEGITNFKVGDRIAASHHVPCYQCHYCQLGHHTLCDTLRKTNFDPGGFSEWIRIPEINCLHGIYKLPEHVSFEEGTLIEPLACVFRGQKRVDTRKGQTVLVIGCGPAGLLHIALAKIRGVKRIIACDLVDFRLEAARQFGADEVLKSTEDLAERLKQVNEGRLADVVIVCAGNKQATIQSMVCAGRGASILFFALQSPDQILPLSLNEVFWQKGITLTSSYAASPEDHHEALELIQSKKINLQKMISHRLGFLEIAKGFQMAAKGDASIKIIIDPAR